LLGQIGLASDLGISLLAVVEVLLKCGFGGAEARGREGLELGSVYVFYALGHFGLLSLDNF
jgi:hypothetical protein